MKEVRVPLDDDEHTELSKAKKDNNLTWKEMLYKAKEKVER